MESVTIKMDELFAREMEAAMKPNYSTKTEFIREAIRDKIKKINLEKIRPELLKNLGAARKKGQPQTTPEDERRIREEVGREYAKRFGIELD
ncbi:hypothetical protein JW826_04380 [Candidatus Woesearchaeota archaeon]|nr:hypothetical protein [Candidatus Woesearchaeota archaeon]